MCRVFGHFGKSTVTADTLSKVSFEQLHGGPDAQSFEKGVFWSLGNNRLAIQGIDGGEQPFRLGDEILVVFNGEIYNHTVLRTQLRERGYLFADECDGNILPALYKEYGEEFVELLDGMFAIALIDRPEEKILLASDPAGVKSLFYTFASDGKTLFFSSEMRGLRCFPEVTLRFRKSAIDEYLTMRTICGTETGIEGVYTLAPSTTLTMKREQPHRVRTYLSQVVVEPPPVDFEEASLLLKSLLREEVDKLLSADVPVCLVTSGGLDSSLLTAHAASLRGIIDTFHVCYKGNWPSDERRYAREVAELLGTRHHEIEADPREFPTYIESMISHLDQPNAAPHNLSAFLLFKGIHEAGFKVAVTGEGADEYFAGYERFRRACEDEESDWISPYLDLFGPFSQTLKKTLYSQEYKHFLSRNRELETVLRDRFQPLERGPERLNSLLSLDQAERMPYYILRRVDHLSMAHAVEVRVPFCQPRIMSFARQSDAQLKVSQGKVKRVLYGSAKGLLPDSVLLRKKQPFTLPVEAMIKKGEALFDYINDSLFSSSFLSSGIFSEAALRTLVDSHCESTQLSKAQALWALMTLERWLTKNSITLSEK